MEDIKKIKFGTEEIVVTKIPDAEKLTGELLKSMNSNRSNFETSHKIMGRWENSYLSIEQVPMVREVMRFARDVGVKVLKLKTVVLFDAKKQKLSRYSSFWFNIAKKGEVTGLHDHASNSELSGVTYLQSDRNSGNLFFKKDGIKEIEMEPQVGRLVLFPSSLRHGVRENRSDAERISLAFNLFHFPLMEFDL